MRTVRVFGLYIRLRLLLLALLEFLTLVGSFYLGVLAASGISASLTAGSDTPTLSQTLVVGLTIFPSMAAVGLYHPRQREHLLGFVIRLFAGYVLGVIGIFLLGKLVPPLNIFGPGLAIALIVSALAIVLVRSLSFSSAGQKLFSRRLLVLGTGTMAASILALRRRSDWSGFTIVGFRPLENEKCVIDAKHILNPAVPMFEFVTNEDIDQVVVALDERRNNLPVKELLACRMNGIDVVELATFFEREFGKIRLDLIQPSDLLYSDGFQRDLTHQYFKRLLDIVLSLAMLAVTWPLMLLVTLAIKLESGLDAPVFYRQTRVTQHDRQFQILKFRSMRVDAEAPQNPLWATSNDSRVTQVGSILRRYRIDELPQLVNVLRGDMSFVGPRPERPEFVRELERTIPFYAERHSVKAGLTGWAQLYYPYGSSEKDALEKLQYDIYYVKHYSIMVDLFVLLRTVEVVLMGKGI